MQTYISVQPIQDRGCRKGSAFFLLPCILLNSLLNVGCGPSSGPEIPRQEPSTSTGVATGSSEETSTSKPEQPVVADPVVAADDKKQAPRATPPISLPIPPAPEVTPTQGIQANPTAIKPVAILTPEQAKLWKSQAYDPIVLMGFRDISKVGVVTCMTSTPDGSNFIVAGTGVSMWSLEKQEIEHLLLDSSAGDQPLIVSIATARVSWRWRSEGCFRATTYEE